MKEGVAESELEKIDEAAKQEAKDSVEFSANAPIPEQKELATDVYAMPWDDNPNFLPRVVVE
jgi:TPP-dependent pyruvate/acetoin dehydrogenase alpha subunit